MRKTVKIIVTLLLFIVVFPTLAGFAVMALWNNIMPLVCGFSTITLWQSVGMFIMGQLISGGAFIMLLFFCGGLHTLFHHHGEWDTHWHSMTNEQRRLFIEQRRREHFGFHNRQNKCENAAE